MVRLSLIVPTYNEAENIPLLAAELKGLIASLDGEVIVVDDNSPDETWKVAKEMGFNVFVRPKKLGLATAFLEGVKLAQGEFVGIMDADLQHPPELLSSMLSEAEKGADVVVVASRYVDGGKIGGWPLYRRFVSRGAIAMSHLLLSRTRDVRDPLSGFFLLRRRVTDGVKLNPRGFKILLEILVRCKYGRVLELPYTFRDRKRGKSKMGRGEMWNYVKQLYNLKVS